MEVDDLPVFPHVQLSQHQQHLSHAEQHEGKPLYELAQTHQQGRRLLRARIPSAHLNEHQDYPKGNPRNLPTTLTHEVAGT